MANFRLVTSLLIYTPTADSADTNYPVTNVAVYANLLRAWKASVATGVGNVTLDCGPGYPFAGLAADPGLLLDDVNFTAAKIQGSTVTSWTSPPWNQAIVLSQDGFTRRYKNFSRLADLSTTPFSYQYLNIQISSQTPTDGGNYRIGRIPVGPITELLGNPLYPVQRKTVDPIIQTQLLDGSTEISLMGARYFELSFQRELVGSAELSQELGIQAVTPGTNVIVWDSALGTPASAWLMRRIQDPSIQESFLDQYTEPWLFRETT